MTPTVWAAVSPLPLTTSRDTPSSTPTRRASSTVAPPTSTDTPTPGPTVADPRTPSTPVLDQWEGAPSGGWAVREEHRLGEYYVREWCDANAGNVFGCYVTIDAPGQPSVTQYGLIVSEYLGLDLTGEGYPAVVIFSTPLVGMSSGNMYVYTLGTTARNVFSSPPVNCRGEFRDIDGDGRFEYVTCDAGVAFRYCAGIAASTAAVNLVLQYDQQLQTYVVANEAFPAWYEDEIARAEALAATAVPNGHGEGDDTTKCGVLPLVLTYLFLKDDAAAWNALRTYYAYSDVAPFQAGIAEAVHDSPFYAQLTSLYVQ